MATLFSFYVSKEEATTISIITILKKSKMVTMRSSSKLLLCMLSLFYMISCSKSGDDGGGGPPPPPPPPPDACQGKTIVITTATTNSTNCANTGGITVTATGSTNFTYKLNATGTYQASNTFANVGAGAHTVFVKDGGGCEKSASVTVTASGGQTGPLFTAVRSLMTGTCQPCHNSGIANGGMNWESDCNLVANKARIKVRAVDESSMPPTGPLSAADKKKITDWIAAGGELSN